MSEPNPIPEVDLRALIDANQKARREALWALYVESDQRGEEVVNASDLAARLRMDETAAIKAMKRLETMGLARKTNDRAWHITGAGIQQAEGWVTG